MGKIFKEVPVEHKHVGKVMFATGIQGDKFCGKIEFYGREGFNSPELFVCSHTPDPKDPYKTTGTRIRFVLEEFEEVEHNPLVEVCESRQLVWKLTKTPLNGCTNKTKNYYRPCKSFVIGWTQARFEVKRRTPNLKT